MAKSKDAHLPPPAPKYSMGEKILFDRADSDYGAKDDEGQLVGTISHIELGMSSHKLKCGSREIAPFTWETRYMVSEHDDQIPEACVLGTVTLGEKR